MSYTRFRNSDECQEDKKLIAGSLHSVKTQSTYLSADNTGSLKRTSCASMSTAMSFTDFTKRAPPPTSTKWNSGFMHNLTDPETISIYSQVNWTPLSSWDRDSNCHRSYHNSSSYRCLRLDESFSSASLSASKDHIYLMLFDAVTTL